MSYDGWGWMEGWTEPRRDEDRRLVNFQIETDGDVRNIRMGGREAGQVQRGVDGLWYYVPQSRVGHAHPLNPLDTLDNVLGTGINVLGTGVNGPGVAALRGLNLTPAD